MPEKNTFNTRLKELRLQRKLNQEDIASAVGMTKQAISDIERGRRATTMDKVVEIANYFDVPVDYLLGRSDYDFDENTVLHVKKSVYASKDNYLMPRFLFEDEKYKKLSSEAKLVYTILLENYGNNEITLEKKFGESLKVSIKYLTDEVKTMLQISDEKACKVVEELASFDLAGE